MEGHLTTTGIAGIPRDDNFKLIWFELVIAGFAVAIVAGPVIFRATVLVIDELNISLSIVGDGSEWAEPTSSMSY